MIFREKPVMPRANRFYHPGYVWHITHRCHKKEFLLKFDKDKKRWIYWLFEAKKRYGLCVLNCMVTSNHIHLLVYEAKAGTIPYCLLIWNKKRKSWIREPDWSNSIAIGSEAFVNEIKLRGIGVGPS